MILKSEAIRNWLNVKTHSDLASLYNIQMECQVNVAQDNGRRTEGEYKGKKWHGWTDDITTWKSFRIPYKANSNPEYTDSQINFDLAEHAEAIGMTGWNWTKKQSLWVAFDFDALLEGTTHYHKKLTSSELEAVKQAAYELDWVTVRKSTSGTGIHLYVFLDPVETQNHNEHAALARSIIGMMSALVGYDFSNKVDTCGGNMWIWHRKMEGTDGLILLKKGSILTDIPVNWKDHIKVTTRARRKTLPQIIEQSIDQFEELVTQRPKITLDNEHKKLISFLQEINAMWWWDQDHNMLVTHTIHLQEAFDSMQFRGYFKTISIGTERGIDHNCFLFPMRKGAWTVRRYTPGVQEHSYWHQDGSGWTTCYFNKDVDFKTACRTFGGAENEKGAFIFQEASIALEAVKLLGIHIDIHTSFFGRRTILKPHKDGRIIMEMVHEPMDTTRDMDGWLPEKNKWIYIPNKIITSNDSEPDAVNYDDIVRHLITDSDGDCGWVIKNQGHWCEEPLHHIRVALQALGVGIKEMNIILGTSIFNCWKIVNRPFQSEYPGDREWNRNAPQLRYEPLHDITNLSYPTWTKILDHIGCNLDIYVKNDAWCKSNGLTTGADYLKCWIASVFKEPYAPLPYLFLHGPGNSGKTTLHEALRILLTRGYIHAEAAIMTNGSFNGELEGAILCSIEEIDLRKNNRAANRVKDWVTSREILIHPKNFTPYNAPNTTHWIQCANDPNCCPILPGDSRITMIYVDELKEIIESKQILSLLQKEAQDFITEIMSLELPKSTGRLNIPVISTQDKLMMESRNKGELMQFLEEQCQYVAGNIIPFSELYSKFEQWLDPNLLSSWSRIKVGKEMPLKYIKGRSKQNNQVVIGNIGWKDTVYPETNTICILQHGELVEIVSRS